MSVIESFVSSPVLYVVRKVSKLLNITVSLRNPKPHIRFLKKHLSQKPVRGCEIGVFQGENSEQYFKHLPLLHELDLVEPYKHYESMHVFEHENNKIMMLRRLKKYKYANRWTHYEMGSDQFFKECREEYDFIFVDGDHSYEQCLRDLTNAWERISPGGVLAGHDFDYPSVARAVVHFGDKIGFPFVVYDKDYWFIKVQG